MLRFKSTFILLVVFLGLLAVVLFYANDGSERKRNESDVSKPLLSSSQINQITEVSFTKYGQAPVILTKDSTGIWSIGDALVDPDEGNLLTKTLQEFPTGRRASKNKESWEGYGVTDTTADMVVLRQNDTSIVTLFLGTPGPSYPSFYMRRDESIEVYLISSNLQQLVDYGPDRWKVKEKVEEVSGSDVLEGS